MFCIQEKERVIQDKYLSSDNDPLATVDLDTDSDDEPDQKRQKISFPSGINLQVYQIPTFNIPKSLSVFPTNSELPKFVNNPLNLANPLALTTNGNNVLSNPLKRILPKLSVTPVKSPTKYQVNKVGYDSDGGIVRYKKNGEVAKKRGPPKGYKRKPKSDKHDISDDQNMTIQNIANGIIEQAQKAQTVMLNGYLSNNLTITSSRLPEVNPVKVPPTQTVSPKIKVPEGTELVELDLDPADWFPDDPYRMTFSRKKNPKWKNFPYQCEHCFKGYRVASTLLSHCGEAHGSVPRQLAIPCPCCPHVSTRKKSHKKHLDSHSSKKHRIFCQYCVPLPDPKEPFEKVSQRFPFATHSQYWYASEESLRLHKKRKHPYAAMFNYDWFCTWMETANS